MSSASAASRATPAAESESAAAEKRPFRVLLAEDDREMCRLLTDTLRHSGYEVIDVSDGLLLVERIQAWWRPDDASDAQKIDLVVSDVRMPWATGLVALRLLRQYDKVTPVILITAFGDEQTHKEAYKLGASAVLDKPFDLDELLSLAERLVRKAESERRREGGERPGNEGSAPGIGAEF